SDRVDRPSAPARWKPNHTDGCWRRADRVRVARVSPLPDPHMRDIVKLTDLFIQVELEGQAFACGLAGPIGHREVQLRIGGGAAETDLGDYIPGFDALPEDNLGAAGPQVPVVREATVGQCECDVIALTIPNGVG